GGVDNKPPGIFWVYALTFRAFGAYDMTAVHAAGFLAMAATCAVIFLLVRQLASTRVALLGALFYGILTAAGNPRLLASNTEVFMMLPLTASVLLALRRQWFWSALLLVAAGAFRQSAAVNIIVLGVGIFWLEEPARRWRAAQIALAGIGAGLIAGALLIELTGSLPGFWRWTIGTLVGYASTSWTPEFVWMRAKDSIAPFLVDMAVFWIAAVALAARWRSLGLEVRLMVVWLVVAMIGSLAGGHL